jgi:DNA polymerase III sliding clamp (beta) subunit (PCNA family)
MMVKTQGYESVGLWIQGEYVPNRRLAPDEEWKRQTILVECAGASLITRCPDWQYPDFEQIIPRGKTIEVKVKANRKAILEAVDRVAKSILKDRPVRLHFLPTEKEKGLGAVRVSVAGDSRGKEDDDAYVTEIVTPRYEGPEILIGFLPKYLADALKSVPADEKAVTLKVVAPNAPAIVEAEAYRAVIMPMHLG